MEKFQNKYRIPSARLQNWDYCSDGAYFVTTNTRNSDYYFGEVVDTKMQLSHIGIIADVLWVEIENHFHNVELGEYVVMPNHIHGILILNGNDENGDGNNRNNKNNGNNGNNRRDDACIVSTMITTELETDTKKIKNQKMAKISPKSGSVSRIIGSYKSAVSKHAHRLGFDFAWQERFYDHIIRDEISYERIENYIINNPQNWENDKFYLI